MKEWLRELLRDFRGAGVTVALYGVTRVVFAALTEDDGLLTPGGTPRYGVAVVGLAMLALRLLVIFVVPPAVAYRIVARTLGDRWETAVSGGFGGRLPRPPS